MQTICAMKFNQPPSRKQLITLGAVILISFYYFTTPANEVLSSDTSANIEEKLTENRKAAEFFSDRDNLVNVLSVVAALPPGEPPSPLCRAPPLLPPTSCDDPGLGELMDTPRRLVTMILFSFELDTLEIAIREMMDIVDVIFLVEATKSHKGRPKPLMWERIKYTDRFSFVNQSQVFHVVVDDILDSELSKDAEFWYAERFQTHFGVDRIKLWNSYKKFLEPDDLFISANVDEVISREALMKLKYCQITEDVISAALWMPFGNFNRAFRTAYPVVGRNHSFGVPTMYKWKVIQENKYKGERLQYLWNAIMDERPRDKYVLGGLHMTDPANLITYMLKEFTATETRGFIHDNFLLDLGIKVTLDTFYKEQDNIYTLANKPVYLEKCDPVESVRDVETRVPWWLECNRARFPYWYGDREPRLVALYDALQHPESYSLDTLTFPE